MQTTDAIRGKILQQLSLQWKQELHKADLHSRAAVVFKKLPDFSLFLQITPEAFTNLSRLCF